MEVSEYITMLLYKVETSLSVNPVPTIEVFFEELSVNFGLLSIVFKR